MSLGFFLLVSIIVVIGPAAFAGMRAAPWLPTRQRDVERMLAIARVKKGDMLYDLGAGDGRFLIHAVERYGARACGYEISLLPFLVAWIRLRRFTSRQAKIRFQDFFHIDLGQADVIACFLTPGAMAKLEQKWLREARPGSRLVSYAFAFPNVSPSAVDKPDASSGTVYYYER